MIIKVKINNWEIYHPRKDIKRTNWLRFQNDFYTNKNFFDFNNDQKSVMIFMLCTASQCQSGDFEFDDDYFAYVVRTTKEVLHSTLKKLQERKILSFSTSRPRTYPCPTNERNETNVTNERNTTAVDQIFEPEIEPEFSLNLPVVQKCTPGVVQTNKALISKIPLVTAQRWALLYEDHEFLEREVLKALNWYEANPRKCPKTTRGWTQALSSWFDRAWTRRAITTKGSNPTKVNIEEILKGLERDPERV